MSTARQPRTQERGGRGLVLPFLSPDEAWMRKEPEWVVGHVLPTNSLALWYGKADTYKTFAAIDLAACIGTGRPWHGHRVEKPGITAYVVAEEEDAFPKRLEAWAGEHQVSRTATQVHQLPQAIYLLDDDWMDALIAAIKRIERKASTPVRLCVIDTLSMCLGKGKEVGELGAVSVALNRVRVATGTTILLIHHENLKGGRARGDTTLEGNWAVRARLEPVRTWVCKVTCQKQSNAAKFMPLTLHLTERAVTLPSGRTDTSLTVLPDPGDEAAVLVPVPTLDGLATLAAPDTPDPSGVPDDVAAVTLVRMGRTGPTAFGKALSITKQAADKKLRRMAKRGWAVKVERGQYEPTGHLRTGCPLAA